MRLGRSVVAFVVLTVGCATVLPPDVQHGIFSISQLREQSDHYVRLAKGDLKGDALATARKRYAELQGAGNGYIRVLKLSLLTASPADLQSESKAVAVAYKEFELAVGGKRSLDITGDIVGGVLKALTTASLEVWKAREARRAELIAQVNAELDRIRWVNWEEITNK